MKEFPDGEVSENPGPAGRLARGFSIARKILGFSVAVLLVAVVVGYNYIMRPAFLEPLIVKEFAAGTNGKIEIKIEQASLFRGFKFSNIVVHPPAGFKQTPILKAREINILYNVYGFFRGKFGVHEIAFKDAEVFLEQKRNIYNAQALLKPAKTKEPEKEEEETGKGKSKKVSWFFDIQIFARFILENFNFTLDAQDASNKVRQYAHLRKFTFNFSLLTRDFNHIDTENPTAAVALLNALVIELNPQKTIDLSFQGPPARVASQLDLFWRLFYDGQSRRPEFISRMHMGQDKIPVALRGGAAQNLSFLLDHKIDYDAKGDQLKIEDFQVKFLGDTLLALTGSGEKLLTAGRRFEVQTGASRVNLGEVFRVVSGLTGRRDPAYSGFLSVKPTHVKVQGDMVEDKGGIRLERLQVRKGGLSFSIPQFDLDHSASVDLKQKPIPVKEGEVKLRANLNGAPLVLDASLDGKKTAINFALRGLEVAPFAAGNAQGPISTTFTATGSTPFDLALGFRVFSPQLHYYLNRGKSGVNRIDFNLKGSAKSSEDFKTFSCQFPVLSFSNREKENALAIDLKSRVAVELGATTRVVYSLDALTIAFRELLATMPAGLQEQIAPQLAVVNPGRSVRADGETVLTIAGGETLVVHATHIAFPDVHVDDIAIKAKARLIQPYIYLDQFRITGLRQALLVSADGALKQVSETEEDPKTGKPRRVAALSPDMRFNIELSRKEENEILDNTFLVGVFSLAGTAKDNIVNGRIKIDDLSFRNLQVRVSKVNMLFPFKHDLKLKKTLNLRAGNKERIIKNYNFNRAYNFSIAGVDIPDPNNKKEWLKIVYPRGSYPAVGASMEYKDNVFIMPVMQMYTLNGVVTISDTLFNLGRLRPSEMEYSSTIQIKDIDLKQLLPREKAEGITDGKLRIDMLFTGNRLDKPVENLNGYVSIFKIGPEFADTVMKAVMPKSSGFVNTLATNTTVPKKMDIEFKDGFVYSDIPMKAGFVGNMLFSPSEIKNRRINIPEFFRRISDEASVYTAPASSGG